MTNKKAFQIVLNPKFKTAAKQYHWINKQLRILFPEYYRFEFSVTRSSVHINMFGQTWENGQLIRYQKSIAAFKSDLV